MKTRNLFLIFAAIVVSTACTRKPVACNDQVLVDSLNTVATAAWSSGDINKIMSIYADDAVVLSGMVKMGGKDSIANGWKMACQYASNFNTFPGVSAVSKDMVYTEGLFTFNWKQNDYSALAKGVAILVWKKQADNTWKITYHEENHGDLLIK